MSADEIELLIKEPMKFYDWCKSNIHSTTLLKIIDVENGNEVPMFGKVGDTHILEEWRSLFLKCASCNGTKPLNIVKQNIYQGSYTGLIAGIERCLGVRFAVEVIIDDEKKWVSLGA